MKLWLKVKGKNRVIAEGHGWKEIDKLVLY
jgi:hypothetical protein